MQRSIMHLEDLGTLLVNVGRGLLIGQVKQVEKLDQLNFDRVELLPQVHYFLGYPFKISEKLRFDQIQKRSAYHIYSLIELERES
jgi:hypothetical protein